MNGTSGSPLTLCSRFTSVYLPFIIRIRLLLFHKFFCSCSGEEKILCLLSPIFLVCFSLFLLDLGWGLKSQFSPFLLFSNLSPLPEYILAIEYHVHICQVSPQLRCGDTRQIWTWCKESNVGMIENCANGEINERSFSNLHPCLALYFDSTYFSFRICETLCKVIFAFLMIANTALFLTIFHRALSQTLICFSNKKIMVELAQLIWLETAFRHKCSVNSISAYCCNNHKGGDVCYCLLSLWFIVFYGLLSFMVYCQSVSLNRPCFCIHT